MRRRWWWVIAALVIIGAPVAWYLGSPLFINRAVEEAAAEAMPAAAVALRRGTFAGADSFHKGEGTATIYQAGSEMILRLDSFRVTNGPDLYVILTKTAKPRSRVQVMAGYIEVAKLKGNIGSQNYILPRGLRLEDYQSVVIYCKPFHVVFASAELAAAQ